MSTQPRHPKEQVSEEERQIIEDRLKTLDEDAKTAESWEIVRKRVLRDLKQPAPK